MTLPSQPSARILVAFLLATAACSCTARQERTRPSEPTQSADPQANAGDYASADEYASAAAPPPAFAAAPPPTPAATAASNPTPAAAPAPAAPPYDLTKDLQDRADYAKRTLGRGTVTTVVDRYVVVAPSGWGPEDLSRSLSLMQNAMNAFYTGRFEKKPERAITVYLFPRAQPYNAFCKSEFNETPCMSIYGFYQPTERAMVMNIGLGLGTLTHELVHPLVEADFYDAPTWLNEGIASVFEAPVIPKKGEIHGVKNWRYPILRSAMQQDPQGFRLSSVFRLSDDEFRGRNESQNYALARYVCQWLDEKKKLWDFYHLYRDTYAQDPKGTAAFAKVMEHSPEEMDAAFERWVKAL